MLFRLLYNSHPAISVLLSGLLLALSWPARGLFPFVFVSMIPLLVLEERMFNQKEQYRPIMFFLYAWMAFAVFNLLTTWWIVFATPPGMFVAVVLNSAFMALPWLLMHVSRRIIGRRQGPAPIIVFWLAFELLHGNWDLSWSWLDLGNVFAPQPWMVQWYSYTGTAGGSFWVLLMNLLGFAWIKSLQETQVQTRKKNIIAGLWISSLMVPIIVSLLLWFNYEEAHDPVHVVVVQPSHDPYHQVADLREAQGVINGMIELARGQIRPETRFVVAPEGINPRGIWMHEAESHFAVRALRDFLEHHPGIHWIFGSFVYESFHPGQARPPEARPLHGSAGYFNAYNSAVMLGHNMPPSYYHKSMLVPGIERMPFFRYMKPIGKLVESFGGISGSLGTQKERTVFTASGQTGIAPAVCYESIYGEFMRGFMLNGASLIFIITNDGWWRKTPGHRQHAQYARLRAIEHRRSIARAASTGISSFIDQRGRIIQKTQWWEAAALSDNINQNHELSFYSRRGNFLGRLSLFLSALYLLVMLTRKLMHQPGRTRS